MFSDSNKGPLSEVSDHVTAQESLATRPKNMAIRVGLTNQQIYKIPLTFSGETTNKADMTRKEKFGERDQLRPTRTVVVVGATGAGKSTMIDSMFNFIVDVSCEDDFRFTMIDLTDDEKEKVHQQNESLKAIAWFMQLFKSRSVSTEYTTPGNEGS